MSKESNMFLKDYLFKGIQREQSVALSDYEIEPDSSVKIFSSTVELFMISALVGCYHDKRIKPDKGETRRIMSSQFTSPNSRYNDLMFIYKLVMLTNKSVSENTEKVNNAFRYTDKKENWDLFEEYVLGGLQVLYECFFPEKDSMAKSSYDDYFDRLYEMLTEFKENDIKEEVVVDILED